MPYQDTKQTQEKMIKKQGEELLLLVTRAMIYLP